MFDTDGGGTVSKSEFREVCLAMGMTPTEEELESMLNELDADGSGDVDLGEFLAAMTEKLNDPEGEEIIADAFNTFDADGSGALSYAEVKDVLLHMGEEMSDEQITELIKVVDTDGDGEVSLEEFISVVFAPNF